MRGSLCYLLFLRNRSDLDDPLPFPPEPVVEKYENVVKPPLFPSMRRRTFAVRTRPLTPELRNFSSSQDHIFLKKMEVYRYLRSLHPYPVVRGEAMREVDNADQVPFDVFRIPKPGHHPAGLGGLVYDVPSESPQQTPLSLEILGRGKELIIESWPPSFPPNVGLEESGAFGGDEMDGSQSQSQSILQDAQELVPSPVRDQGQEQDQNQENSQDLILSPIRGEKEKNSDNDVLIQDLDMDSPEVLDTSVALGGMLDKIQEDLAGGECEMFTCDEVFAPADDIPPPPTDISLPPLSVEEFIPSCLRLPNYVNFVPKFFDVKNNGTVRFLIVQRPRGKSNWTIPSWLVASQVLNAVQNQCYDDNNTLLSAFHWANPWRGAGLVSLFTSGIYVDYARKFRVLIAGVQLPDFPEVDFNTYPKDLLPCSEVTILMKTVLKNFKPKHIPADLFKRNTGLRGSLRLLSVKPVPSTNKSKKGEEKVGWQIATLRGNDAFFESLKKFPESYPFFLACAHVHIRGGSGRQRGFPKFKTNALSSSSSSSSAMLDSRSSSTSGPLSESSRVSGSDLSQSSLHAPSQALSSVVISSVNPDDVVLTPEEMSQLLPVPSSALASSQDSLFNDDLSQDIRQHQIQQQQQRQQQQQQQQQQRPFQPSKDRLKWRQQQVPRSGATSSASTSSQRASASTSTSSQRASGSKSKGRGRGFNRDKKVLSKESATKKN